MKRNHLFHLTTGDLLWVSPPSALRWNEVRSRQLEFHQQLHSDKVETWSPQQQGEEIIWIPANETEVFRKYQKYYEAIATALAIPLEYLSSLERHLFFVAGMPKLVEEKWLLPSCGLEQLLGVDYKPQSSHSDTESIPGTGECDLDVIADTCLMFGEKAGVAEFLLSRFSLQEMIAMLRHASDRQEQAQKEWDKKMKSDNQNKTAKQSIGNTSKIQAPPNLSDEDFLARKDTIKSKLSHIPLPDDF